MSIELKFGEHKLKSRLTWLSIAHKMQSKTRAKQRTCLLSLKQLHKVRYLYTQSNDCWKKKQKEHTSFFHDLWNQLGRNNILKINLSTSSCLIAKMACFWGSVGTWQPAVTDNQLFKPHSQLHKTGVCDMKSNSLCSIYTYIIANAFKFI